MRTRIGNQNSEAFALGLWMMQDLVMERRKARTQPKNGTMNLYWVTTEDHDEDCSSWRPQVKRLDVSTQTMKDTTPAILMLS